MIDPDVTMADAITLVLKGAAGTMNQNRPEPKNGFTVAMGAEICAVLEETDAIRAVNCYQFRTFVAYWRRSLWRRNLWLCAPRSRDFV